jgi:hypothetical protein
MKARPAGRAFGFWARKAFNREVAKNGREEREEKVKP